MPRRGRNARLVKIHRNYSVDEAARLLDVHKNTIRTWIESGLPVIDKQRPTLMLGREIAEFLAKRRNANKRPCGPWQIYCMRCRNPQHPAGGMADYEPISTTSGNLVGLCPACGALMYRRINTTKLSEAKGKLDVRVAEAARHIGESRKPSVNSDLKRE